MERAGVLLRVTGCYWVIRFTDGQVYCYRRGAGRSRGKAEPNHRRRIKSTIKSRITKTRLPPPFRKRVNIGYMADFKILKG